MNHHAIYHEAKSKFAYAYDHKTLHIRIRTAKEDVDTVKIIWGDPFHWQRGEHSHEWVKAPDAPLQMKQDYSDQLYDYWFAEISPEFMRTRYAFLIDKGDARYFFGAHGVFDLKRHPEIEKSLSDYFNFPYINREDLFDAPAWVKDTVWYQIFPERFANGDASLNKSHVLPWGSKKEVTNEMHFGGDLQGIIDHLDYIADLGATGIYFTPIFEAPTTHKYDTIDYYKIDPAFGTNETFKLLVQEAHKRGIRVMLDAVFNHCGFKHPYFQDVVKNGLKSPYAQCFHIKGEPVVNFALSAEGFPAPKKHLKAGDLNYETFAFTPNMPKWRTGNPVAEAYLLDIASYWIREYDIDGWRLDVSNEVSHDFWRKFRTVVKALKPEVFILGENWDDANPWLRSDQFDSVMNYEFTYPVWHLLSREPEFSDYGAMAYKEAISRLLVSYPKNVAVNLFNLLDSHDTSRLRTLLSEDDRLVAIAFVLQMSFGGSPSVYYGSEVGLFGVHDGNRQCMVWEESDQNLHLKAHVKRMIALRREHTSLKEMDIHWLNTPVERELLAFSKGMGEEAIHFIFNLSDEPQQVDVSSVVAGLSTDVYAARGLTPEEKVSMAMPPFSFRILR